MNICVDGQQYSGEQSDRILLQTTGTLVQKESAWYITYLERAEDGAETKVTLKLQPNRAVMLRSGAGSTRMEFCPECDTPCSYDTGAGILPMIVRTHAVIASVSSSGGTVELIYSLLAQNDLLSKNDVQITLTPLYESL